MQRDIDEILITRQRIDERVRELAEQIADDFRADTAEDRDDEPELTIISILTGSLIFLADLIRAMPLKMRLRMITVSSYPGRNTSSVGAQIEGKVPDSLDGQHVLIVDDILDSGETIRLVREILGERNPASMRTAMFLRKDVPTAHATEVDYVAFEVPDKFVVGYGLDYDGYYRNLPEVVTLKAEVIG